MQLLKKYSAMFIPVGIALVAVIMIVATILMGGSLKKQMAASSTQATTIKQLQSKPIAAKQWEVEKVYQDAHQKDADAFAAYGTQSSQRGLLSYTMFPAPEANETSNTIFHNFAKDYTKALDDLVTRMKAGQPHTAAEMATATRSGQASGSVASLKEQTERECRKRAESMHIYASPYAFAGYDYGSTLTVTGRDKALAECWYWQTAYWIQEDIVDTIVAANASAKNELDAPIKRLMAISFGAPDASLIMRMGRVGGGGVASVSSMAGEGAPGGFALDAESPRYARTAIVDPVVPGGSLTGRVSNEDMDVVHFSFAVVMRTSDLMPFIKQLCSEKKHVFKGFDGKAAPQEFVHNQIAVIGGTVYPVDLTADEAMNYRYGDDALYKVNLVCEYVFNRSGYEGPFTSGPYKDGRFKDGIKPAVVKNPPAAATGI
jgi:hypothetical protein